MEFEKVGRYLIKERISQGGMGLIFLAVDPILGRDVAVKMLPRETKADEVARTRFERESRLVAALEHPGIVPVYDYGIYEERPYLVMRYMAGGSLADQLRHGPLDLPSTIRIVQRLASALDKVHAAGIIHRDLKPANILFDTDGNPYLSDFGIARLVESVSALTGEALLGTPAYMSPEQIHGEHILDRVSDVYAMGVIVFEALSGVTPYSAETNAALLHSILNDPVPDILHYQPDLPPALRSIFQKGLHKDRRQRYATVGEFSVALSDLLSPIKNTSDHSPDSETGVVQTIRPLVQSATVFVCAVCGYDLVDSDEPCPECGGTRRLRKKV